MNKKWYVYSGLMSLIFLISPSSFAQHKGISFQGVIKLPDGTYPTKSGVTVNARILSPNDCILREENFTGVNISKGYINLALGTGAVAGSDPGLTLKQVMNNSSVISNGPSLPSGLVCLAADGSVNGSVTSFDPTSTNGARKFRMSLYVDSIPVVADFNMRSMAYAINSETLEGKAASDFASINNAKGVTQTNLESVFDRFTKLDAILNGFSVAGTSELAHGGTGATTAAGARTNLGLGPLATMTPTGTADNTTFLRGDGTWASVGSLSSETDPTVAAFAKNAPGSGLVVNGSHVLEVDAGTTANKIVKLDGSGKLPAVDGSALTNLPAGTSFSGALTGDVAGTQNATVVEKLNGVAVSSAVAGDSLKFMKYVHGSGWQPQFVKLSELKNATGTAAAFNVAACTAAQTLVWSSITDQFACQNISGVPAANITGLSTVATSGDYADLINKPAAVVTYWAAATGGINYASGNVGVGTGTPVTKLDVAGEVRLGNSGTGCSGTNEGAVRYNSSTKNMEFCDGTAWAAVAQNDVVPDSYSFTNQNFAYVSSLYETAITQIMGFNQILSVSITGGGSPSYRICLSADCSVVIKGWGTSAGQISSGQFIQIRASSPATLGQTNTVVLNIGTTSASWAVVSAAGYTPPGGSVLETGAVTAGAVYYLEDTANRRGFLVLGSSIVPGVNLHGASILSYTRYRLSSSTGTISGSYTATLIGGGGAGGFNFANGGNGGGSGYISQVNLSGSNSAVSFTVGAGGVRNNSKSYSSTNSCAVSSAQSGVATVFTMGTAYTANGGNGGYEWWGCNTGTPGGSTGGPGASVNSGNAGQAGGGSTGLYGAGGAGGAAAPGGQAVAAGGGGGGGYANGGPNAEDGPDAYSNNYSVTVRGGKAGTGFGSGGGGACGSGAGDTSSYGGAGSAGAIVLQW